MNSCEPGAGKADKKSIPCNAIPIFYTIPIQILPLPPTETVKAILKTLILNK